MSIASDEAAISKATHRTGPSPLAKRTPPRYAVLHWGRRHLRSRAAAQAHGLRPEDAGRVFKTWDGRIGNKLTTRWCRWATRSRYRAASRLSRVTRQPGIWD